MQLHRYIKELPLALRRPLVFGDREQISALYDLEAKIERMEAEQAKISSGALRYFDVTIDFSGSQEIEVLATSKADAEEKATEIADFYSVDIETDCVSAVEIKRSHNVQPYAFLNL